MFDPELWKRSKVTVIVLVSVGGLLVAPAAFVFILAGFVLTEGSFSMVLGDGQTTWFFFSAVGASAAGALAWGALVFLLCFQRNSIRAHLFTWPLVIAAGVACFFGSLVWVSNMGLSHLTNPIALILFAVLFISPFLVGFGIANLRRARRSRQQMS